MENQRIRLSKTMLKSGLLQLLKEKPLNQITIYEICETAQINRTTFYKYYGSQMDLLEEIESDFLTQLNDVMEQNPNDLNFMYDFLYRQRELFCLLIASIPSLKFVDHLYNIPSIRQGFQKMTVNNGYSETEAGYAFQFLFQGLLAVTYIWLSSDHPEPAAEFTEIAERLIDKFGKNSPAS